MDEEKQFFIDENMSHRDDAECNTCQIDHQQPANRYRGISKRAFMFHVVVFLLYTVVLVGITRPHSTDRIAIDPSVPYSPANGAVQYEKRKSYSHESPFLGEPRLELDLAWHELMKGTAIRVSEEELQRANMTSIGLHSGGFMAGIGVYHELHCIKRIKQYLYPEWYYANSTKDEMTHAEHHLDHCLEVLRQSVLCNADFSLYTFAWKTPLDRKPQTISDGQKKCVRWDKLEAWVLDRAVDASVDMILPSEEP